MSFGRVGRKNVLDDGPRRCAVVKKLMMNCLELVKGFRIKLSQFAVKVVLV